MSGFEKKYLTGSRYNYSKGRGMKRGSPDYPSSGGVYVNTSKKRKLYEVPDDSPVWNMPLPRSLKGEKKGLDTAVTQPIITNTTSTNADIYPLNLIQQGSASWNRVGRKTQLKSVRVKGRLTNTFNMSTGDVVGNVTRMALVWDKQPSGNAIPNFDAIFGTTTQTGTESSNVFAPPKYDNMDRFRILKDETFDFLPKCQPLANSDFVNEHIGIDCYLMLSDLESVYQGQSNPMTISDISSGALYLVLRAVENTATTSIAQADLNIRVRYSDN